MERKVCRALPLVADNTKYIQEYPDIERQEIKRAINTLAINLRVNSWINLSMAAFDMDYFTITFKDYLMPNNLYKPHGIYASKGDWLFHEIVEINKMGSPFINIINVDYSKIKIITNMAKVTKFDDKYGYWEGPYRSIRWHDVSKKYRGLCIIPDLSKELVKLDDMAKFGWIYGYDVSTLVIWNPKSIVSYQSFPIKKMSNHKKMFETLITEILNLNCGCHFSLKVNKASYQVAKRAQPLAQKAGPVADKAQPIANKAQPIANKAQPIANKAQPIANKAQPIANKAQPIANKAQPVANKAQSVANEADPVGPITDKAKSANNRIEPVSFTVESANYISDNETTRHLINDLATKLKNSSWINLSKSPMEANIFPDVVPISFDTIRDFDCVYASKGDILFHETIRESLANYYINILSIDYNKIKIITNLDEAIALTNRYGYIIHEKWNINWNKFAQDYHGICIIPNLCNQAYQSSDFHKLYWLVILSYEVSILVVWDRLAIKSYKSTRNRDIDPKKIVKNILKLDADCDQAY